MQGEVYGRERRTQTEGDRSRCMAPTTPTTPERLRARWEEADLVVTHPGLPLMAWLNLSTKSNLRSHWDVNGHGAYLTGRLRDLKDMCLQIA